jgi:hypothetical protein
MGWNHEILTKNFFVEKLMSSLYFDYNKLWKAPKRLTFPIIPASNWTKILIEKIHIKIHSNPNVQS